MARRGVSADSRPRRDKSADATGPVCSAGSIADKLRLPLVDLDYLTPIVVTTLAAHPVGCFRRVTLRTGRLARHVQLALRLAAAGGGGGLLSLWYGHLCLQFFVISARVRRHPGLQRRPAGIELPLGVFAVGNVQ